MRIPGSALRRLSPRRPRSTTTVRARADAGFSRRGACRGVGVAVHGGSGSAECLGRKAPERGCRSGSRQGCLATKAEHFCPRPSGSSIPTSPDRSELVSPAASYAARRLTELIAHLLQPGRRRAPRSSGIPRWRRVHSRSRLHRAERPRLRASSARGQAQAMVLCGDLPRSRPLRPARHMAGPRARGRSISGHMGVHGRHLTAVEMLQRRHRCRPRTPWPAAMAL